MRNYLKMRCMVWTGTGPVTANMGAWGGDDDELGIYVRRFESEVKQSFPTITFQRTPPHDVYWLLDSSNFAVLLNGLNFGEARNKIDNCSLLTAGGAYSAITSTESPRKTWSHGD